MQQPLYTNLIAIYQCDHQALFLMGIKRKIKKKNPQLACQFSFFYNSYLFQNTMLPFYYPLEYIYYAPIPMFLVPHMNNQNFNHEIERISQKETIKEMQALEEIVKIPEVKLVQQKHEKLKRIQKVKIQKRKSKKKIQNPNRNVLTNIAYQIYSFILLSNKAIETFDTIVATSTGTSIEEFYDYINKLKHDLGSYINIPKLNTFFYGNSQNPKLLTFHKVIRILSKYFIDHLLITSLLTSKRLSKQMRVPHLDQRKVMLNLLTESHKRTL